MSVLIQHEGSPVEGIYSPALLKHTQLSSILTSHNVISVSQ